MKSAETESVPERRLRLSRPHRIRSLSLPLALLLGATIAAGQQVQPLKPADRSSPRAALQTFLDAGDAFGEFAVRDYLPSPSHSGYDHLILLGDKRNQGLDLSEVPPAARTKTGYAAANALYEVLSRIPLPPPDQIPDADQIKAAGSADTQRWVIPDTEIALVRAKTGPRSGEFLFSADTVARAGEFYERVRGLPYIRPVPLKDIHDIISTAGGWMIPYAWIQALPAWLRVPIAGQSVWKWIGLILILGALALFLAITYRVTQLSDDRPPLQRALARLAMPVAVLLAMPVVENLTLVQLVLAESVGSAVELATTGITFLACAWLAWRLAAVVAEAIIASPLYGGPETLDSHIIRGGVRLVGIVAAAALLTVGADRVGMPLYGIIAGLGVGGLALALATQPTIENLIAGISLVADKAVRIGEYCKYGDALGTIERVGIRSTRIRGDDRTLTNIPNAVLAKLPIVSHTRDQMLLQTVLGLRYETTPEQLRCVLDNLRQLLKGDPRVMPESARARLVTFGDSSLDVEVFAYVKTTSWAEFLGIREDLLLRMMDIVEQAGTEMAFPSQTLYLGRDRGSDPIKARAAEANVREWRDKGSLG